MDPADRRGTDGGDTLPGYRPVSLLAVGAAAAGLVSALALVSPVFWVLPLVGAVVAVAALAEVSRRDAPKAGRLAALAGLGLSLGFGAQAVAAAGMAEWLARGRAETAVAFWLEAIAAGRLDDARGMCGPEAAAAVDRVAACGPAAARHVRCGGRDVEMGARIVRATVGACAFDVALESTPPLQVGQPERLAIAGCDAVTPSAN